MTMSNYFEKSADGSITILTQDAPESLKKAIYEMHNDGEILPSDWIYEKAQAIADSFDDYDEIDEDTCFEIANSHVDVMTKDLIEWSMSHKGQWAMDEYFEEYGPETIGSTNDWEQVVGRAQSHVLWSMTLSLLALLHE